MKFKSSEEYFKSEKEMVAWLNEFAAKQLDYEDSMRLTEISIKLHFKTESEKLRKLRPEKLDSSELGLDLKAGDNL